MAAAVVGQRYNDKVGDDLAGEARTGVETADEEESLVRKSETERDGKTLCINGGSDQEPGELSKVAGP